MPSIEYAIDQEGRKVYAHQAVRNNSYKCAYCLEDVDIRRGRVYSDYFAHSRKDNRTPLQRTCPGYTGIGKHSKIENELDKTWINSGGIPLYLSIQNGVFELRAHFPAINENDLAQFQQQDIRIIVNPYTKYEEDKAEYTISNLNYYRVNRIQPWIDVKCKPEVNNKEVKRKWLWGIRGIDVLKDIYHCSEDGGYRIALKSNVNVGKKYRMMFQNIAPDIEGIEFVKVGDIELSHGPTNKRLTIYEMKIEIYTEDARKFIESKGYCLQKEANELIPLWPPAIFMGNELTFDNNKAFFIHINNTKQETVYCTYGDRIVKSNPIKNTSILAVLISKDKSIIVSDKDRGIMSTIKYNILYSPGLITKEPLVLEEIIKDIDENMIDFAKEYMKPPGGGKLWIDSNIPFNAFVTKGNYVVFSSTRGLEYIDYDRNLRIDYKAFGVTNYTYKRENYWNKGGSILNIEDMYLFLYRCTGPTVSSSIEHRELLYLLKNKIKSLDIQTYRLIENWINTNKIPIAALESIKEMQKRLGGLLI